MKSENFARPKSTIFYCMLLKMQMIVTELVISCNFMIVYPMISAE